MAKEEIKKFIESSKNEVNNSYDNFSKSIKDDLKSFKKKTLDRI